MADRYEFKRLQFHKTMLVQSGAPVWFARLSSR